MPSELPAIASRRSATVAVEVENSSWIVERGVRHTEWFVRLGDAWTRVAELPADIAVAAAEGRGEAPGEVEEWGTTPAGCQYLRRFRLLLPVGTPLRRRVSRPREARIGQSGRPSGTLDLERDVLRFFRHMKPPVSVVETEFRVVRRGVVTEARWAMAVGRRT